MIEIYAAQLVAGNTETAAEHNADSLNDAAKSDALNSGPRYCVDCRHYQASVEHSEMVAAIKFARCTRVLNTDSLLSPSIPAIGRDYCSVCRELDFNCGREGKYWELRSVAEPQAK
jgi:hypothetical protein